MKEFTNNEPIDLMVSLCLCYDEWKEKTTVFKTPMNKQPILQLGRYDH